MDSVWLEGRKMGVEGADGHPARDAGERRLHVERWVTSRRQDPTGI